MTRKQIYCALATKYGWGPEIVSAMTPFQQIMYLQEGGSSTSDGMLKFDNWADYQAYRADQ